MIKYLSRLYLVRKNNFSEEFEALLSKKKGRKQKRKKITVAIRQAREKINFKSHENS